MSWVAIDGSLVPREEAKVSVYDRGFLYGDSIFETLRTYGGRLFRLDEHLTRFERSAEITQIVLPVSRDLLASELERLTRLVLDDQRSNDAPDEVIELTVRIMVTRGEGPLGLVPSSVGPPSRVTFFERFRPPSPDLYDRGATVLLVPTYRPSDAARGAKVGNYLESLLCLARARESGADEALVVDAAGRVIEGTTSNVFVVRSGVLFTPPVDTGLLVGVTRNVTLELAAALGIETHESPLFPDDFDNADEAFLTSTLREIMPIGRIVGRDAAALSSPGPVTSGLRSAFSRLVETRAL